MAKKSRSTILTKIQRVLKKHYTPETKIPDRPVLEHVLYACLLENSPSNAADQAFENLKNGFFDWNEIRVSTVKELSEALSKLHDPEESSLRLKRVLQHVFEATYSFDLESLKKQAQGKAIKELERMDGSTPFTVAYVVQNALGGHVIPINAGALDAFLIVEAIDQKEHGKGSVPGLERSVGKAKGPELASLVHQWGADFHHRPYSSAVHKILLEIDPGAKARLPKRPTKKELAAASKDAEAEKEPKTKAKKAAPKKKAATKSAAAKPKKAAKKKAAKAKTTKKKVAKKKKSTTGTISRRKPR